MATQYLIVEDGASLPDGIVLAHTLHGEPANQFLPAHAAPHGAALVIPVGEDGIAYDEAVPVVVPYVERVERPPEREKRCTAKDDTCMGWAIGGYDLCAAHAGVFKPKTPGGHGSRASTELAEGDPEQQVT